MTIKQTGGIFGRHPSFGDIETGGLDLSAISGTIGDTAVDIFVYDTRKDSDGGAWRKRTQHTSWYNETLNTSTRGSRKEFPAVAVIVAESNQVTIYDGDDPDLPMWMVFDGGTYRYVRETSITSAQMLNGILFVTGNVQGSSWVNLIADASIFSLMQSGANYRHTDPVSGRNNNLSTNRITVSDSNYYLANNLANDVAMTVLPNAPIDAATGLPVPTIAVATDGGLSVIRDDGTVVDTTSTNVFKGVSFVKSQYGADLYAVNTTFADDPQWYPNVGGLSDGFTFTKNFYANTPSYEKLSSDVLSRQSGNVFAPIAENTFAVGMGTSIGIGLDPALNLVQHSTTLDDDGLVAYINNDHNTGWMNGAIKLATLSDTDDTNVTGSELVTNGTFDSDISGWTASDAGCSLSLVSNQLRITNNDATAGGAVTSFSVVSGKVYTFNVGTSSKDVWLYLGNAPNTGTYFAAIVSNSHTWTSTVTGTVYFMVKNSVTTNGDTVDIDNVSVRLAEEDRSVNGNGLQVFGTVTKSAVATGADLVGYSGFSASNYLEQPYNPDLEFDDTDSFCAMIWFKSTTTSDQFYRFRDLSDSGGMHNFLINTNGVLRWGGYGSTSGTVDVLDGNIVVNDGSWHFAVAVKTPKTWSVYVDGKFDKSMAAAATGNYYGSSSVLRIGLTQGGGNSAGSTSMALFRISTTAPSPEQIKKIYEDEKVLFQENAQATLYGSSDAVTALAYDDATELLHAGTSAGRSVFQGLRRVDNTTDAVGAAISASNGLVADE